MDQTQKYIKVLNWGYVGFAPMTLSPDYKASLEQAQQRLSLLDDLDYNALLNEALGKGKGYLARYTKTDDTFEYGLHFMTNLNNLIESLQPDYWDNEKKEQVINHNRMFRGILNGADKFGAEGLWTDEQWKEYRATINQIEKVFEDRLKQFATAYDYKINGGDQYQELLTEEAKELFERALNKGLISVDGDKYKWIDTASLYGYFVDKTSDFLNIRYSNDRVPWKKYEARISNHSNLLSTARQAVNDYTNKELPPPEGDDKVDDICK